jgi:hypothetical protein
VDQDDAPGGDNNGVDEAQEDDDALVPGIIEINTIKALNP